MFDKNKAASGAKSCFSNVKNKIGKLFKLAGVALAATGAVNIYKSLTKDSAKAYIEDKKVFYAENHEPEPAGKDRSATVEDDLSKAGVDVPAGNDEDSMEKGD